jgi:hypothetical protein
MGTYSDITREIADSIIELGAQLDTDVGNSQPPVPPANDCLSGVYTGSSDGTGRAESQFADWRNRDVGLVMTFTPDDTWSADWWVSQFGGDYPYRDRLCITRSLCLKNETVESPLPGDVFADWARKVKGAGITNPIYRLGHEFNGGWYAWKIEGHETTWAPRYELAAKQILDVDPTARICYCYAAGQPLDGYDQPDAQYVDLVGVDLYDNGDQAQDWPDLVAIAGEYGVPLCVPEWGLWASDGSGGHGDNPSYIDWMADRTGDLVGGFEAYFDKDSSSVHKLEHYPSSQQRYLERFGG